MFFYIIDMKTTDTEADAEASLYFCFSVSY